MPERRPDPAIEVFGLDEEVWADPRRPDQGATSSGSGSGSVDADSDADVDVGTGTYVHVGSAGGHRSDEIRQGDQSAWPGYGRRRSAQAVPTRIPLVGGRTATLSQLAAAVAALVVAAFLAGLVIGNGTRPKPGSGDAAAPPTFQFTPGGAPDSIFPTEPSFTIRVAEPGPLPSGTGGPKGQVAGSEIYALQLAADPATRPGQSLERRDAGALSGPWSLVVRRSDGWLGHHSSVVTYPATVPSAVRTKARVRVGSVTGYVDGFGGIVWPIGARFAGIRGDLGRTTLAAIAGQVSIRHDRPAMDHPPSRFRVVASEPYRAPLVAESRYNSLRVNSGPIDGLIFTDVLRCASFEEALFVESLSPGGNIGGHPAEVSSVGGGTAALAWEPTPGSIVLVGYSGELAPPASTASLIDLARGGRLLDRRQWAATHPTVVKDTNAYS